jgi:DNA-binding PadR family transcriptional regulator
MRRRRLNGEYAIFLENVERNEAIGNDFVLEAKAKLLRSYSKIAILAELTKEAAVSAKQLNVLFEKNCGVRLSPGTLYPILYRLENRGYIRELPKRKRRLFVLTDLGRKVLDGIEHPLKEIQVFIICLLTKNESI